MTRFVGQSMRLWPRVVVGIVCLSQVACATYLVAVEGQDRLFRDKTGLYEIRIPEHLPDRWWWGLPATFREADLVLARKWPRLQGLRLLAARYDPFEAEIFVGHPFRIREDLDLRTIVRRIQERKYSSEDDLRKFQRIGSLTITPKTSPQDVLEMKDLLVEAVVGPHRIVETAPEIYKKPVGLKADVEAYLRIQDKLMLLLLISDLESLDENKGVLHELIENIRLLPEGNANKVGVR